MTDRPLSLIVFCFMPFNTFQFHSYGNFRIYIFVQIVHKWMHFIWIFTFWTCIWIFPLSHNNNNNSKGNIRKERAQCVAILFIYNINSTQLFHFFFSSCVFYLFGIVDVSKTLSNHEVASGNISIQINAVCNLSML